MGEKRAPTQNPFGSILNPSALKGIQNNYPPGGGEGGPRRGSK